MVAHQTASYPTPPYLTAPYPTPPYLMSLCVCSYRDYRSNTDYTLTSQFWLVLAVRFAFVVLFEVCAL